MKKTYLIFSVLLLLIPKTIYAQYYSKPDWVNNPPEGYINYYFVGFGVSFDYQKSLQFALANATQKFLNKYKVESFTLVDKTPIADRSRVIIKVHGEEKTILLKVVDTFVEFSLDGYNTYILVSSPRESENVRKIPTNTGALIRSTLIPGWGHFYKEHKERGLLFIVMEGIALGTAIVFYNNTINRNDNQFRSKLNIILGITLGIHILNIIDSYTIEPNIKYK